MTDGAGKSAVYDWGADGLKRSVRVEGDASAGFSYLGSLVYTPSGSNYTLESVAFPEGRFVKTSSDYEVQYQLKDHLGSVRATMNQNGVLSNQSDYYPFGERWSSSGEATTNRYLFSGKEKQTAGDLQGMNLLDFGARMYDPEIPRWLTQDPLAEKYYPISAYVYTLNSPIRFIDPNGMDIYRYDEKTGVMVLYEENDDKDDKIGKFKYDKKSNTYTLKTNKKGEARTRIKSIAKGILKDGINFRKDDHVIAVGGPGQPSLADVESFVIEMSDMVDKEIGGYYFTNIGDDKINNVYVSRHETNSPTHATSPFRLPRVRPDLVGKIDVNTQFHTHLRRFDPSAKKQASWPDYKFKNNPSNVGIPNFIILTYGHLPIKF